MTDETGPVAIRAAEVPPRGKVSIYPESIVAMLGARLAGREKRQLGEVFGLENFGVNLTRLAPNAVSALRHAHSRQDEFVYVLQGCPTLYSDDGAISLSPGMCAGFRAGSGNAHRIANETAAEVVFLEVGDRTPGDVVTYPDDDLRAVNADGKWVFTRKDGSAF